MMTKEPTASNELVILSWPSLTSSNPFPAKMTSAISDHDMDVHEFTLAEGLFGQFDILLMHWPERVIERRSSVESVLRLAALACIVQRCRFLKRPIVWTAHNQQSHDQIHPRLERLLRICLDRYIDGVVHLSEYSKSAMADSRPLVQPTVETVVRHGQDTAFLSGKSGDAGGTIGERALSLLAFGVVRPYKRLPHVAALVDGVAFRLGITLSIAGPTGDEEELARLRNVVDQSKSVTIDNRYIPEDDLDRLLWQSDAAIVAHSSFLNSGTVIHALSRGTPVLAPAVGSIPEIVRDVGTDWVFLYEPPFTAASLEQGVEWLRTRDPQSDYPDLARYSWAAAGGLVADLLHTVLNRVRSNN